MADTAFNFDNWFNSKGKNKVTNVGVPVPGKEKPAKFRLDGICNAQISDIIRLGNEQLGDIRGSLPVEETKEGVTLRRRAEFEPADFGYMLTQMAEMGSAVETESDEGRKPASQGAGTPQGAAESKAGANGQNRLAGANV